MLIFTPQITTLNRILIEVEVLSMSCYWRFTVGQLERLNKWTSLLMRGQCGAFFVELFGV